MEAKRVLFTEPNVVELETFDANLDALPADRVAIRNHYSLISPGTELACLSGTESWARLPFVPGYAGCGEVVAVGADVDDWFVGDRVFSYTKHASVVQSANLIARVPDGLDMRLAVFARMAAVSITALRVSEAELGDWVAVYGLGLVGNLAAQLFALAGCTVVGIDLSPKRCAIARLCGVRHALNPDEVDVHEAIADLTDGHMCQTVVEAIGAASLAEPAARLAGKLGEVVLLGSPRAAHEADVTELLRRIHLWGDGCVTFKGAHEWRYPIKRDPAGHIKHSIGRNVDILLGLIASGTLHVEHLITHILPPDQAPEAYAGLCERRDEYLGVLLDWTHV